MELVKLGANLYTDLQSIVGDNGDEFYENSEIVISEENLILYRNLERAEKSLKIPDLKRIPVMAYGLLRMAAEIKECPLPKVEDIDIFSVAADLPDYGNKEQIGKAIADFRKKDEWLAVFVYEQIDATNTPAVYEDLLRITLCMYYALDHAAERSE